jgi:RNA polymerase sigma factor (sigma-70 family)
VRRYQRGPDLTKAAATALNTSMPQPMRLPPFQTLVDEHAGAVAAYLRGMLGAAEAEDAVQDTYLAALRAYPGFDGAHPRAWLMTIARRKAIDVARARARGPEPLAEPDEVPAAAAEPPLDGLDRSGIWARVAGLPPKQREALLLRFGADLRYREVGIAMGCSEAAARRSVHEGLTKLRKSAVTREEVGA